MRKFTDIRNAITIVEQYLGMKGLEIHYIMDGNEHSILANPEQSCPLLKTVGIIEDYTGAGDDMAVEIEMEAGNCDSVLRQCHWEQFIMGFGSLSQLDAHRIAAIMEDQKQIDKWSQEFRSIPSLIKRMGA